MPFIKIETIAQLSNRIKDGVDIVAPLLGQHRGHPVGFNQRYKEELMALNDDVGARHIIKKYQKQLELIPSNDTGVISDIDQVSDIFKLRKNN